MKVENASNKQEKVNDDNTESNVERENNSIEQESVREVKKVIKKLHSKTRETNTYPYASLNGKAWINDVVIDKYGELIMQQYPDVYIFSSLFSQGFLRMKRPYITITNSTRLMICSRKDLFSSLCYTLLIGSLVT